MPSPEQEPLEIHLGGSLEQSTGSLFRGPAVLERCRNGDHRDAGYLRKARGLTSIDVTTTTHGEMPERYFLAVGVDRGELVLVGYDQTYAVAAPDESIDGAALVLRGPTLRGYAEIGTIHGTTAGDS